MEITEIKKHWQSLAETYKKDLLATTKTRTIKALEIDALSRAIQDATTIQSSTSVLEVGCGNGHNCIALKRLFPDLKFLGIDYVPEMIQGATQLLDQERLSDLTFQTGDILKLNADKNLAATYDIIFTVRCIINLPDEAMHLNALAELASKVASSGSLILLENYTSSYGRQNELRTNIGLETRTPDRYNCFLNERSFVDHAKRLGLSVRKTEDFASLHDILLYVLLPSVLEGKIEYEHPLMHAVTTLLVSSKGSLANAFGSFGQNRLYHFVRE